MRLPPTTAHGAILLCALLLLLLLPAGCCSTRHARPESSSLRDSTQGTPAPAELREGSAGVGRGQATVMRPNLVSITAEVESLTVIDTLRFRITVLVTSAVPGEGVEAPPVGQRLSLVPRFVLSPDDPAAIDLSDARNQKFLSLRRSRPGNALSGTIVWDPQQGWVLMDIAGN